MEGSRGLDGGLIVGVVVAGERGERGYVRRSEMGVRSRG